MAKNRRYRWRGFGEQARTPRAGDRRPSFDPVTSTAPATGPQITYVRNLRRRLGIPLSASGDHRALKELSKAEASAEIQRLRERL